MGGGLTFGTLRNNSTKKRNRCKIRRSARLPVWAVPLWKLVRYGPPSPALVVHGVVLKIEFIWFQFYLLLVVVALFVNVYNCTADCVRPITTHRSLKVVYLFLLSECSVLTQFHIIQDWREKESRWCVIIVPLSSRNTFHSNVRRAVRCGAVQCSAVPAEDAWT